MLIEGTAHPPPCNPPQNVADFNAAEISTTRLIDRPVLVEHTGGERGKVLSSWEGTGGELRVLATVTCPDAIQQVRTGSLSELSLGTSVFAMEGSTVHKQVREVSLVEKGARHDCVIDTVDGRRVRKRHNASAASTIGACK